MFNEIMRHQRQMEQAVKMLRKTGEDYARAERDYKVLLRQEALKLKDSGMAVGLIEKTVYGVREVADARFKRDCAEAVYKANQESINTTKLTIKILMNQYDKEWGHAPNDQGL